MKNIPMIVLSVLCLCFLASTAFFAIGGGYIDKVSFRYFGVERTNEDINNGTKIGWERCLEQLNYDSDIVFFGDSITSGHNWQKEFPGVKVVNLGVPGDALQDMYNRLDMVVDVKPEKIFIMGGVNGIRDGVTKVYLDRYALILDELKEKIPNVEIYVQSVLPVSKTKEGYVCKNSTIAEFNKGLQQLTEKRNCIYVDLYSLYLKDGEMNTALTSDGIHLKEDAYSPWVDAISDYIK